MNDADADIAEQMELRDELLVACRDVLAGIGTREAAGLVRAIEAILDLDAV